MRKKVESRLKLTANFVTRTNRPTKSLMMKDNMKGIERISKTSIKKYKNYLLRLTTLLHCKMMMTEEYLIVFQITFVIFQ